MELSSPRAIGDTLLIDLYAIIKLAMENAKVGIKARDAIMEKLAV